MIPKWKFALYSFLAIVGIVFVFLLATFFVSLVIFLLSAYGFMYMPLFGLAGVLHTLRAVPTLLFLCAVVLIVAVEVLSRNYSFSFRKPFAVTLLLLTTLTLVTSFAVNQTPIHDYVHNYARSHHIEMMENIYKRPLPFKERGGMTVVRGTVIGVDATGTILRLFDGKDITLRASSTEASNIADVVTGDDVVAVGFFSGGVFDVTVLRDASEMPFGGMMGQHRYMMMGGNGYGYERKFQNEINSSLPR